MDYEKKYKEALEKARQLCAYPTTKPFISDLQDLFPELAETEDERIKKELLENLRELLKMYNTLQTTKEYSKVQSWIAWLEKQGGTFTKKDVDDAYLKGVCDAKQELEKQAEQKDSVDSYFEGFKHGEECVVNNYGKYGLQKATECKLSDRQLASLYCAMGYLKSLYNDLKKLKGE